MIHDPLKPVVLLCVGWRVSSQSATACEGCEAPALALVGGGGSWAAEPSPFLAGPQGTGVWGGS